MKIQGPLSLPTNNIALGSVSHKL